GRSDRKDSIADADVYRNDGNDAYGNANGNADFGKRHANRNRYANRNRHANRDPNPVRNDMRKALVGFLRSFVVPGLMVVALSCGNTDEHPAVVETTDEFV